MFDGNYAFNQQLDKWDVFNVQNMYRMFGDASSFNQPLNTWNVANVQNMQEMFAKSTWMNRVAFSQNLCSWGVKATSLTNVGSIFSGTQCPYTQDPVLGAGLTSPWCTFCFGAWNSNWKNVGSNAQQSFTAGASWSNTTSNTYTGSFTTSFSGAFEESAMFEGTGAKMTISATESLTATVSSTLSYAETHSWTFTCATPVCNNGVLFQLVVEAPASDGTTQSVQTCNFSCVPQSIPYGQPMCPLGFCSDNTCQCCNDLWIYGNSDPTANHLEAYNGNGGTCKTFCVGNDQPCDDNVTCCSGKCSKSGICQQNYSLLQVFH
jgi:surface protein